MEWIITSIIAGVLVIIALILFFVIAFPRLRKRRKSRDQKEIEAFGKTGEEAVDKMLEALAKRHGGYVYHEFIFKDSQGYSCEIDHIYISRGGFFVIETNLILG